MTPRRRRHPGQDRGAPTRGPDSASRPTRSACTGHKAARFETTIGRIIFNRVPARRLPLHQLQDGQERDGQAGRGLLRPLPLAEVGRSSTHQGPGFHYATRAGLTVSVCDAPMPPTKEEMLAAADDKVADQRGLRGGPHDREERHNQVVNVWTAGTEEVGNAMPDTSTSTTRST